MGNAEELCRLAALLEKGLITQEEFQAEKAKIFGIMPPVQNTASSEMLKARDLAGLALLLERGLITDEEFKIEKKKLFEESETTISENLQTPIPTMPQAPPVVQNISVRVDQSQNVKVDSNNHSHSEGCSKGCLLIILGIIILIIAALLISPSLLQNIEGKGSKNQSRTINSNSGDITNMSPESSIQKDNSPITTPTKPSLREQFLIQQKEENSITKTPEQIPYNEEIQIPDNTNNEQSINKDSPTNNFKRPKTVPIPKIENATPQKAIEIPKPIESDEGGQG